MKYKKTIIIILFFCGLFIFYVHKKQKQKRKSLPQIPEKPMVVVIPSYNNKQWYQQNLNSVFKQQYNNYRVIYIDDCSEDGTGDLAEQYIAACGQTDRVTLIKNKTRRRALANHYHAVHMCDDHEIIVQLDGDDWFKHNRVLQWVNRAYANEQVWLTYGQYEEFPSQKIGRCKPLLPASIAYNCYRECSWVTSALRTFYAGLFKQIALKDFMYNSDFFTVACDLAFMFPMLEMAGTHAHFIDEVLYVYNRTTGANDDKVAFIEQVHADNVIRARKKYMPIDALPCIASSHQVALLVSAEHDITQAQKMLNSVDRYVQGATTVHIMYKDPVIYEQLHMQHPNAHWHQITHNLHATIADILNQFNTRYVLFASDDWYFMQSVDLQSCADALAHTHAHGFYLQRAADEKNKPSLLALADDLYAWQFKDAAFAWRMAYSPMTLYAKASIQSIIAKISCDAIDDFEGVCAYVPLSSDAVGLCRAATCCARYERPI